MTIDDLQLIKCLREIIYNKEMRMAAYRKKVTELKNEKEELKLKVEELERENASLLSDILGEDQ